MTTTVLRSALDDRDRAIVSQRAARYHAVAGPRVGDYVDFRDGVTRRIAHVWDWGKPAVQTSTGGSFYLGDGFCAFSGGLYPGIPTESLTLMEDVREGCCWFFHHDWHTADNGVTVTLPWRVYRSTCHANR